MQINDSSLVISVLKSHHLGKLDVGTLLTYYPYVEETNDERKQWWQRNKTRGEYMNIYRVMYGEEFTEKQNKAILEEAKWRKWVDDVFVHTLAPNIYRNPRETLQAMEYIMQPGYFTQWEATAAYYVSSLIMYLLGKLLKHKHKLRSDERESLYEEAVRWTHAVGKKSFLGGKEPNLADLNMYGVISAIEGLDAFQDLMDNTDIRPWYARMKKRVTSHSGTKDPDWLTLVE